MKNIIKNIVLANSLFFCMSSFAGNSHEVKLYMEADATAEKYMKTICLSLNNGFTKSCGNGASRSTHRSQAKWKIVSYNLKTAHLGADSSCQKYLFSNDLSDSDYTFLHTTLNYRNFNTIPTILLTNCIESH